MVYGGGLKHGWPRTRSQGDDDDDDGTQQLMSCNSWERRRLSDKDLTVEKGERGRGIMCGEHLPC